MSDNMIWLLGLMFLSFCLNAWIIISVVLRMSAEKAEEESTQKKAKQLFPDAISISHLETIIENRKLTLAQMAANGDRLSHLYSLSDETKRLIEDYLRSAAHCQNMAIYGYRIEEHLGAAQFANLAKEQLQLAFDKLYPTTKDP